MSNGNDSIAWRTVFSPAPLTSWLRGDSAAWVALAALLGPRPVPATEEAIEDELLGGLREVTGLADFPRGDVPVHVPRLDRGGMSGGAVTPAFWRVSLIPLLRRRAVAAAGALPSPRHQAAARALAVEIARCPQMAASQVDSRHPCRTIVSLQGAADDPQRQVPEAWMGGLTTARVLFLSSNPSISELGDAHSRDAVEDYPLTAWSDDTIASFITDRCNPDHAEPWMRDDRFRRTDGTLSPTAVRYWAEARKRASEVLGYPAEPSRDYAMTEVVRCKSKAEQGVADAATRCADLYLERTLALCPAPVLVVVGAHARDRLRQVLGTLPSLFGRRSGVAGNHVSGAVLGGIERLVVYLPHFTSMEAGGRTFTARFGAEMVERLRAVANSELRPLDISGAVITQWLTIETDASDAH